MATGKTDENPPDIQTPSTTAAVSIKLPPYWANDPIIWFAQVEAQFTTRNITSEYTKYAYVVSSLQPNIAQEVGDLLVHPPTDQPYTQLKDELIKHTSASEQKRLHLLLTAEQLGDKIPSQLLRKMQQLLGENKLEESILKQFFLKCLPSNIQLILASTSEAVNITQLADLADKIVEASEPAASAMSAVSAPTFPTLPKPVITALQVQVEQLASQVQALTCQLAQTSFVYAYIDDILVASNSLEQHHQHLRLLFSRLSSLSYEP